MIRIYFISAIILFSALLTYSNAKAENTTSSITVLASSSLTNVMTELIKTYSIKGKITVSATYKSPSELARDIENGETADIYISEHPTRMRDLKRQGLIDVFSLSTIATNKIVLVASTKNHLSKKLSEDIHLEEILKDINEKTLLVIGDPDSVPIGVLARAVMEKLGYWEEIKPFIVRAANTRNALYLIAKGKGAGVIYYTDAIANPEVKIIANFPRNLHDTIIYQVAVVAGENMQLAREFLVFLKSNEAKKIFIKHGFPYD